MSDDMNVYEKLQHVQSILKAPKSQYNKFGNYYYRNCEDIQEAAKPIMQEVKAVLVVGDELVMVGDRYYIKATARFVDCESGEAVENTSYAREELDKKGMDASQITGSSSSYARKYALNGLFCIDDTKDADTAQEDIPGKKDKRSGEKKQSKKLNESQVNDLIAECQRTGKHWKIICQMYNADNFSSMDVSQYEDCMKRFKNTPDKPSDTDTAPPDDIQDGGLSWNDPKR